MSGALEDELEPGERLLWSGRPSPERAAARSGRQVALGFVCCWIALCFPAVCSRGHFEHGIYALSEIVAAAGMLIGMRGILTPIFEFRRAQTTAYALTDRRGLSIFRSAGLRKHVTSLVRCEFDPLVLPDTSRFVDVEFCPRGADAGPKKTRETPLSFRSVSGHDVIQECLAVDPVIPRETERPSPLEIDPETLPPNMAEVFAEVIATDESILWLGKGTHWRVLIRWLGIGVTGYFLCMFSTCVIAVTQNMKPHDPAISLCFLAPPLLLTGLYMVTLPFFEHYRAERSLCVITDRRAVRLTATASRRVASYRPEDIVQIERIDLPGGIADIVIQRRSQSLFYGNAASAESGFFGVPNARRAELLLLHMKYRRAAILHTTDDKVSTD